LGGTTLLPTNSLADAKDPRAPIKQHYAGVGSEGLPHHPSTTIPPHNHTFS